MAAISPEDGSDVALGRLLQRAITMDSAQTFLKALHKACQIRINELLIDNGKEFTDHLYASKERDQAATISSTICARSWA